MVFQKAQLKECSFGTAEHLRLKTKCLAILQTSRELMNSGINLPTPWRVDPAR